MMASVYIYIRIYVVRYNNIVMSDVCGLFCVCVFLFFFFLCDDNEETKNETAYCRQEALRSERRLRKNETEKSTHHHHHHHHHYYISIYIPYSTTVVGKFKLLFTTSTI